MAIDYEEGQNQNNKEEKTEEPEKTVKEKIKDFEKLDTAEDKQAHVDEVLGDKANLIRSAKEIEIEAAGGESQVKDKAGVFDKLKIKVAGVFSGEEKKKEIEYNTIAKIAHKEVDKELKGYEATLGKELLEKKASLVNHEKNSEHDLKSLKELGIHSEEELKDITDKLVSERSSLKIEVETRKSDLKAILGEYSSTAFERQGQLAECIEEYQGYHDHVITEKRTTEQNIGKYERGLAGLKLTGGKADEYKERVKKAINDEKEKLAKLLACEKALKDRLEVTRANKSEVDIYLERINNIGKTPTEISKQKADVRKAEADKKAGKTTDSPTKQKTESADNSVDATNEGTAEDEKTEPKKGDGKEDSGKEPEATVGSSTKQKPGSTDNANTVNTTEVEAKFNGKEIIKTPEDWKKIIKSKEFNKIYDPSKNENKSFDKALDSIFLDEDGRLMKNVAIETVVKKMAILLKKTNEDFKEKNMRVIRGIIRNRIKS